MISPSLCGPLCQHPGCWKARGCPPRKETPDMFPPPSERIQNELPTLSVSLLEPQKMYRHRSLPPIKTPDECCSKLYQHKHDTSEQFQNENPVPRVSHIIVQAGFQCHSQKRWIWLPSLQSQQPPPLPGFTKSAPPPLKDLTDEMLQSRPNSSKFYHTRNIQTRLMNSRPKGSSYLDLIKKMGHINLLDLPHYLQVKLLENNQFRKVLSTHPIDNIPYNVLSDTVLLDLMRCQLSPQLPANPSLDGVGIFFDPPDDLTVKQEPKALILPRPRHAGVEPSTYVPSTKKIVPSELPGPLVTSVGRPSFRDYVLQKRSESNANSVIEVPQVLDIKSSKAEEECSVSHVTSITTTVKDSSEETHKSSERAEDEEEGEETMVVAQSLEIVLPADSLTEELGIRIPSAVEESEEPELMGITSSLPPTRDSWRHTSFSTVTPCSETVHSAALDRTQLVMTPPLETTTISATSVLVCDDVSSSVASPDLKPDPVPPTCTPTNEFDFLEDEDEMILQPDEMILQLQQEELSEQDI